MKEVIGYARWGMAFSLIQSVQLYGRFPNTAGSAEEVTGNKNPKKHNTNI